MSTEGLAKRLDTHLSKTPRIHSSAYIAPGAVVVGDVTISEEASVWYQSVLRGDINRIIIGPRSNIQDGSIVHLSDDYGVQIGELVTVGHAAIVHACTIADEVLIGMGATVMDGTEIGARSIVGAGALVLEGRRIPPGSLVLGSPAKVVRTLSLEEQKQVRVWAEKYVITSRRFLEKFSQ